MQLVEKDNYIQESLQKLDDMRAEFVEKEKSIGVCLCVYVSVCLCVDVCMCVYDECSHDFLVLAGLKSKKQQMEHNQHQLQEKIGHVVTGIS